MELVLGIDLGTSYFKLGLFDRAGELRGLGRVAVPIRRPDERRCELRVEDFWSCLRQGIAEALAQASAQTSDIRAIGYSSQASSFVLLDAQDRELTSLILWPDVREEVIDPRIVALWDRPDYPAVTGLGIRSPEFAVVKLRHFQLRHQALWSKVRRVLTISDYLVYSLTGNAAGDEGTASLLGLLDLRGHCWWDAGLEAAGIEQGMMVRPLPCGSVAGVLTPRGQGLIGLGAGLPLAVGSLDHYVAALGAGIGRDIEFCESTGTVLACVHATDDYRPQSGVCVGPGMSGRAFCEMTFDSNGASVLEWYHRNHAPDISIPDLVSLAEKVECGAGGLTARPCANNYPGLDGFIGRKTGQGHGHFVRAIMESTAASLLGLVGRLCPTGRPARILATGGGARSDLWRQIKADLLGVEFLTPVCKEPACFGAAMIASTSCGWFGSLEQASAWARVGKHIAPDSRRGEAYRQWHQIYRQACAAG